MKPKMNPKTSKYQISKIQLFFKSMNNLVAITLVLLGINVVIFTLLFSQSQSLKQDLKIEFGAQSEEGPQDLQDSGSSDIGLERDPNFDPSTQNNTNNPDDTDTEDEKDFVEPTYPTTTTNNQGTQNTSTESDQEVDTPDDKPAVIVSPGVDPNDVVETNDDQDKPNNSNNNNSNNSSNPLGSSSPQSITVNTANESLYITVGILISLSGIAYYYYKHYYKNKKDLKMDVKDIDYK